MARLLSNPRVNRVSTSILTHLHMHVFMPIWKNLDSTSLYSKHLTNFVLDKIKTIEFFYLVYLNEKKGFTHNKTVLVPVFFMFRCTLSLLIKKRMVIFSLSYLSAKILFPAYFVVTKHIYPLMIIIRTSSLYLHSFDELEIKKLEIYVL